MMNVKWRQAVSICVVTTNCSCLVYVLKRPFDTDMPCFELKLELPKTKANLLQFLANKKLQIGQGRKRMHADVIAN